MWEQLTQLGKRNISNNSNSLLIQLAKVFKSSQLYSLQASIVTDPLFCVTAAYGH